MNPATRQLLSLMALSILILGAGCGDRDPASLEIARARIDPVIFDDALSPDVYFQPFALTNEVAVQADSVYAYDGFAPAGARSLKISVAPEGSALGIFSGGVLTAVAGRDLADFNALTFYARADVPINFDVVGFGNDNTGTSLYEAGSGPLALSREWKRFVIPIPASSKMIAERGLFTFAESVEAAYPDGYSAWFDEIRFAALDTVGVINPSYRNVSRQQFVGSTVTLDGVRSAFHVGDGNVIVSYSANYFDFESSDPSVADVVQGRITILGAGTATLFPTLNGQIVRSNPTSQTEITLTGYPPPTVAADPPTLPAASVISMFSDVYDDVPVDTWRANWTGVTTQLQDYRVAGDNTKLYSALNFVGIEFQNPTIDASGMEYFHLDVMAPEGEDLKIELASYPPDLGTGVQTPVLALDANSDPAFRAGDWVSLDIPLDAFELPEGFDWAYVGLLVLSSATTQLVLVDNVYWHK